MMRLNLWRGPPAHYWFTQSTVFSIFAKYTEPISSPWGEVCDAEIFLRHFLPIFPKSYLDRIKKYSCYSNLADTRVVCMRPDNTGLKLSPLPEIVMHFDTFDSASTSSTDPTASKNNTFFLYSDFCFFQSKKGTNFTAIYDLQVQVTKQITPPLKQVSYRQKKSPRFLFHFKTPWSSTYPQNPKPMNRYSKKTIPPQRHPIPSNSNSTIASKHLSPTLIGSLINLQTPSFPQKPPYLPPSIPSTTHLQPLPFPSIPLPLPPIQSFQQTPKPNYPKRKKKETPPHPISPLQNKYPPHPQPTTHNPQTTNPQILPYTQLPIPKSHYHYRFILLRT